VPNIPGVNHLDAVRALEKVGIARDAGLSPEAFRKLL
jgi:hypothetical protein